MHFVDSKCVTHTTPQHHMMLLNNRKTADSENSLLYIHCIIKTKQNSHFLLCYKTVINLCKTNLQPTKTHRYTHLPCSEFPVRCQAISCIHEDFGNAQSFLDGLQLEPQQVAVNAVSFKCLNRAGQRR